MTDSATQTRPFTFQKQVIAATPGISNLERCIQCGTCGGSCPSGPDMDHTPRALFALINAEMVELVLKSNTPWFCVSCYYCMTRCPQDVHITDLMYTLKRFAIHSGFSKQSTASAVPGFSETFISYVENYGRSFELGLATIYLLTHHPLGIVKMVPMGLGMMIKGRMNLVPQHIKGIEQLKAILRAAKELEAEEFEELGV